MKPKNFSNATSVKNRALKFSSKKDKALKLSLKKDKALNLFAITVFQITIAVKQDVKVSTCFLVSYKKAHPKLHLTFIQNVKEILKYYKMLRKWCRQKQIYEPSTTFSLFTKFFLFPHDNKFLRAFKSERREKSSGTASILPKLLLPYVVIDIFDFLFSIFSPQPVPKSSQSLGFEVPKFWHSISSDAELLDEELEEEVEETTTHHEPYPFFEEEHTQLNETTQLGNDVYLHCRVQNLGEKIVSQKLTNMKLHFPLQLTRFLSLQQGFMGSSKRWSTSFDYVRWVALQ